MCRGGRSSANKWTNNTTEALYHNEVVEEEDFSLVRRLLLGLVDIGDLEEPTAAHQPSVRDREDLRKERSFHDRHSFSQSRPFFRSTCHIAGHDKRASTLATPAKLANDANLTGARLPLRPQLPVDCLYCSDSTQSVCLPTSRHSSLRGTQTASQLAPAGRIFHYGDVKHVKTSLP